MGGSPRYAPRYGSYRCLLGATRDWTAPRYARPQAGYSGVRDKPFVKPFYAYMLECFDRSFYVGHTDDLAKRVAEHANGQGCAYTRDRLPVRLVWFQDFLTRDEAKAREAQIKPWSRKKKEALIRGSTDVLRAAARKDWYRYRERRDEEADDPE